MKHYYIVTGVYSEKNGTLSTHVYRDIEDVFELIKHFSSDTLLKLYKTARDLEFDVQSRRSHNGAVIINDSNASWSIFYA